MEETAGDGVGPVGALAPNGRPSRSAARIVVAVAVAVMVLAGLAWWVLVMPYNGTGDRRCGGHTPSTGTVEAGRVAEVSFERSCRDARSERRQIALLVGAGVAITACAVSTVPSRRLTGERLGPLR